MVETENPVAVGTGFMAMITYGSPAYRTGIGILSRMMFTTVDTVNRMMAAGGISARIHHCMILAPSNRVPAVRTGSQAIFTYAAARIALTGMFQAHQRFAHLTSQRMARTDMSATG